MTDRDSTPTSPIEDGQTPVSPAPTMELPRDEATRPAVDPYAPAAAVSTTEPKKPFFRRTGSMVGLAAVALLLLGLIFGAGFALGRVSSAFGDGRSEIGPGGGFGPRDGVGSGRDGSGHDGRNGPDQDSGTGDS